MESSRENTDRSSNGKRTLVVMAKAPKPGMVKTRLSPSLPVEAVTELYRCLLNDTIALAHSTRALYELLGDLTRRALAALDLRRQTP